MSHGNSSTIAVEKPTSKPIQTLTKTNALAGIILIALCIVERVMENDKSTMIDTLCIIFIASIILFTSVQILLLIINILTRTWDSVKHALIGIITSGILLTIAFMANPPTY